MPAATKVPKRAETRRTAEERRDELLKAALAEFANHGLHGTSTEVIARRTGISQPYIFRLFPSKKDLFLAAIDQCYDRVEAAFRGAASDPAPVEHEHPAGTAHPSHPYGGSMNPQLHAIGHAYVRLLAKRELLLFQMQAYAACSEADVRSKVKQRWERLMALTAELSGASQEELTLFVARGMLMTVTAAIGLVPDKAHARWAHETLGFA